MAARDKRWLGSSIINDLRLPSQRLAGLPGPFVHRRATDQRKPLNAASFRERLLELAKEHEALEASYCDASGELRRLRLCVSPRSGPDVPVVTDGWHSNILPELSASLRPSIPLPFLRRKGSQISVASSRMAPAEVESAQRAARSSAAETAPLPAIADDDDPAEMRAASSASADYTRPSLQSAPAEDAQEDDVHSTTTRSSEKEVAAERKIEFSLEAPARGSLLEDTAEKPEAQAVPISAVASAASRASSAASRQPVSSAGDAHGEREEAGSPHGTELQRFPSWWFTSGTRDSMRDKSKTIFDERVRAANSAPRGTFQPTSKWRLSWDAIAMLFVLIDFLWRPFEMAFLQDGTSPGLLAVMSNVATGFFCVDILLNFNTGYLDSDVHEVVMERRRIAVAYLRSWFVCDLFATVPWDILIAFSFSQQSSGSLSSLRLTKAPIAIRTIRYLKMLRAVRLVKQLRAGSAAHCGLVFHFAHPLRHLVPLAQQLALLTVMSHVNACVHGWAENEEPSWDLSVALAHYHASFCWAFAALVSGVGAAGDGGALQTLDVFVTVQRLVLIALLSTTTGFRILQQQEEARFRILTDSTLRYLNRNKVGVKTQIQVLYGLQETHGVASMANHYKELMSTMLPSELRERVCMELWSEKVLSLGLFVCISEWNGCFVPELTLVVREEIFASRSEIFAENDPCTAAYHVIRGTVAVISSLTPNIDDFTAGQWLGEKALVSHMLHRSGSAITKTLTDLMVIPAKEFHELIKKHGLEEVFMDICEYKLMWGLCGRCGSIGTHFSDACPVVREKFGALGTAEKMVGNIPVLNKMARINSSASTLRAAHIGFDSLGLELQGFLRHNDLISFAPLLHERGIRHLHELAAANLHLEESHACDDAVSDFAITMSQKQRQFFSPEAITAFKARSRELTHVRRTSAHMIFISHCKVDAGTEASLLRSELEHLLVEHPNLPGSSYEQLCFLDSEDLQNLEQLQELVKSSANVAVLLTANLFTRPWCLVEIWTAVQAGIPMLPVQVAKPGNEFRFPTEEFYDRFVAGELLDASGMQVLLGCGADLEAVASSIRTLCKKIAVTYSPHKAKGIRKAELKALLMRCTP